MFWLFSYLLCVSNPFRYKYSGRPLLSQLTMWLCSTLSQLYPSLEILRLKHSSTIVPHASCKSHVTWFPCSLQRWTWYQPIVNSWVGWSWKQKHGMSIRNHRCCNRNSKRTTYVENKPLPDDSPNQVHNRVTIAVNREKGGPSRSPHECVDKTDDRPQGPENHHPLVI